jgi:hypothetical protein
VKRLKAIEKEMLAAPDQQISFTDPDSRSMATSGRGSGMVGYNVQAAVDTTSHLIVAHEVTNVGTDKSQLANMAWGARRNPIRLGRCSELVTFQVSTEPVWTLTTAADIWSFVQFSIFRAWLEFPLLFCLPGSARVSPAGPAAGP